MTILSRYFAANRIEVSFGPPEPGAVREVVSGLLGRPVN